MDICIHMKQCVKCQDFKPIADFLKEKRRKSGVGYWCKECWNKYQYNTFHKRYLHWKSNAKYRGILFEVTEPELNALPKVCHYTGIALTTNQREINTISLDRLNSNKGYVTGNVVFCCESINTMKQDFTYDQFILTCRWIVEHHDALINSNLRGNQSQIKSG